MPQDPAKRALAATTAFLTAGLLAWVFLVSDWRGALVRAFFYGILLVNTYFSIRFFFRISPLTRSPAVTDGALFLLYLGLSSCLDHPAPFMAFALSIFIAASAKYALLLTTVLEVEIVKKKIVVDALGVALCAIGLVGALAGYEAESAIAVTVIFAVASVYLLVLRPMYAPWSAHDSFGIANLLQIGSVFATISRRDATSKKDGQTKLATDNSVRRLRSF